MFKEFQTQTETEREVKYFKGFTPNAHKALRALHVHLEKLLKQRDASFIFKAPAGAGKSTSLLYCLKVLKRQAEQEMVKNAPANFAHTELTRGSVLVTVTPSFSEPHPPYTLCLVPSNHLVNVYSKHLGYSPSIHIRTLEELAWELIEPFQCALLSYVTAPDWQLPQVFANRKIVSVVFDALPPMIENGTLHLSASDVKKLFFLILTEPIYGKKFSRFFKQRYSTVLIDEYQTFPAEILNSLLSLFLKAQGQRQDVLWGLFGDPWQGEAFNYPTRHDLEDPRLLPIIFNYNLRSAPSIVNALNILCPEKTQVSALQDQRGGIIFISCSDYSATCERSPDSGRSIRNTELQRLLSDIEKFCAKELEPGTYELFILNETQFANALGFKNLQLRLKDQLQLSAPRSHSLLNYCFEFLEPLYRALNPLEVNSFFKVIRIEGLPVITRNDKREWSKFYEGFSRLRHDATVLEVLFFVKACPLFDYEPYPYIYEMMLEAQQFKQQHPNISLSDPSLPTDLVPFLCQYSELLSYYRVFDPLDDEHSVYSMFKTPGYSYDNVFIVTDNVCDLFNYNKNLTTEAKNKKNSAFIQKLLTFYKIISRTRHNLYIFDTGEFTADFEAFCTSHLPYALRCSYHDFKTCFADLRKQQITQGIANNTLINRVSLEEAATLAEPGDPDTYEVNHV